ncbi:MAG TPA: ATP-binding protein [Pyrinomonadaceae bacterium]|nr:ATP-binding protein [Pyrinomonadaceae bacterium]
MERIILRLDLGDKFEVARQYQAANPQEELSEFLKIYPARFPANGGPSVSQQRLPVSAFLLFPVRLEESETSRQGEAHTRILGSELDDLWQQEQSGELDVIGIGTDNYQFPEDITDNRAVRTAYRHEMDAIADYLRNGLSVLVSCDKILTEFIYEFVCSQAGKKVVLDTTQPDGTRMGAEKKLEQALQGGPANPLANLPVVIHNLKPGEVLVLRSLDLLDTPPMIELLYQRSAKGEKPQLLAFLDPSLEAKKVLTDRLAVHVSLTGLPRYISLDGKHSAHTVTRLLTREEHARFAKYDPEGLYKNVSGLNAIQFRHAMNYVGAKVAAGSSPNDIYRVIRQFKTSSNDEIEIPDTTFDDIGGYESVKHQLRRIIMLVAGPIEGISDRQRGDLIPRGFIFHGPPGTGKTLFAKAIANEMNATIQMISGPEIMDKYVGQSENNLRRIFATARRNAPAVVFFDEFDSIASQRSTYSDGGARANNAVVAQFLTELDGFRQDQAVLIIGTSNRIDIIDEALLRPSRLRPIEIGLPDHVARHRVAEIHAANFGIDKLLKNLCLLATKYLNEWEKSGSGEGDPQVPEGFLSELFNSHPRYQKRYAAEERQASFIRDVRGFFTFIQNCRQKRVDQEQSELLTQMTERLTEIGSRYGVDLATIEADPGATQGDASLLPMRTDLRDIFDVVSHEMSKQDGLAPEAFFGAVMDLIAEYTVRFNNDEIRAIFQEASLEHYMEGQLITPRYLGQKIGLINKRRDERESVHLSGRRGRG